MVATVAAVRPFKSDLCENAHQQFVDVVIDAHRHFDILGPVRARQIPALWKLKKNMRKGQRKNSHGYRRRTTFDFWLQNVDESLYNNVNVVLGGGGGFFFYFHRVSNYRNREVSIFDTVRDPLGF